MQIDRRITKCEKELWRCVLENEIPSFENRRGSTQVSTVTEIGQICHNKYIFNNNKKLSKLKSSR